MSAVGRAHASRLLEARSALALTFVPAPFLLCSFPGLYESLHHKVRGAWDVQVWSNYLAYRGGLTQLPWDPNFGEVDESKRREIMLNIAGRANVKPEELGFNVPAAAAPAAAAPANKH